MILRKPYAFFIKYFKLFHVILTTLISYLIYQTGVILSFFNEYINTSARVTNQDLTGQLFNIYMFIIPFLIIMTSVIILSVMYVKKKPILFYVILILIYLVMIFIYNYTYGTLGKMETILLDVRTVRLNRDIITLALVVQVLSVIITFVRATGFDIKKFNFGQDLEKLEISEEDREEFEVEVTLDTDKVKRGLRRNIRYIKYIYIENKVLINLIIFMITSVIIFITYLNFNVYNKVYYEKEAFFTNGFNILINESYVTRKDYSGKVITEDDMSLVILEVQAKNNYLKERKLDIARMELVIEDHIFFHKYKYAEKLYDLGKVYFDETFTNNYDKYLLVYEVPSYLFTNNDIKFIYIERTDYGNNGLSPNNITVELSPRYLDTIVKTNKYILKEEINFENSILGNTKLVINDYDIASEYKLDYRFCIDDKECYNSYEYLLPDVLNQYQKTILYLNGQIDWDKDLTVKPIVDLYKFIDMFGTIKYTINNREKEQLIPLKEVSPTRIKKNNDYYIELLKEIENATQLSIIFNIRDIKYEYKLK